MKKTGVAFLFVLMGLFLAKCKGYEDNSCYNTYSSQQEAIDQQDIREFIQREGLYGVQTKETESGSSLKYLIVEEGDSTRKPRLESKIHVNYRGYFITDEKKAAFDSAYYAPEITLSQAIKGWQEGLPLIGEGGKIKLMIPSYLAYGNCGYADIPPNTPLYFDVELVYISRY